MVCFFVSVLSPFSSDLYSKLFAYHSLKSRQEFMTDTNIVQARPGYTDVQLIIREDH